MSPGPASAPEAEIRRQQSAVRWRRAATWAALAIYLLFVTFESWRLEFDPLRLLFEFRHLRGVLERTWPPNFAVLTRSAGIYGSLLDTLCIAFLGTLWGGLLAFGGALLMAANTTPHPLVRGLVAALLTLKRSVPVFVVMLMMQVAVGIGSFSTVLSIALGTMGMFGKLFAEDLEAVDPHSVEALAAIGATRSQQVRYAILPAAAPMLCSHWIYAFDINVRMAIALGVFGGGGIGFELYLSQRLLRHADMFAIVLVMLVLVTLVDSLSDKIRERMQSRAIP